MAAAMDVWQFKAHLSNATGISAKLGSQYELKLCLSYCGAILVYRESARLGSSKLSQAADVDQWPSQHHAKMPACISQGGVLICGQKAAACCQPEIFCSSGWHRARRRPLHMFSFRGFLSFCILLIRTDRTMTWHFRGCAQPFGGVGHGLSQWMRSC